MTDIDRRRPLGAGELSRLARALDPGGKVVHSRPLLGGLDWGTYAIDLEVAGARRALVLRRFDGDASRSADAAERLWTALEAIRDIDLAVPHPVLLDRGELLGAPAIVMTRCDGAIRPPPPEPAAWIRSYAHALARLHGTDLSRLSGPLPRRTDPRVEMTRSLERPTDARVRPAVERLAAVLRATVHRVAEAAPVLAHGDFWFGNTLWVGDELTGIVDWSGARLGDARADVAYAVLDVQLVVGPAGALAFEREYEAARHVSLDLAWWQLLVALDALAWLPDWVDGYHEVGLADLTIALARERLDAFIDDALERSAASAPKTGAVEGLIRESIERGELSGLPGEGRPLRDDGLPTDERWAAAHVLRNAGAAPEWAELRRQIDAEMGRVVRRARAHAEWLAGRAAALASTPADRILEATRATAERDGRVRAQIDGDLEELNRLIRRYDLLVPPALQVAEVSAERVFGRSA